MHSQGIRRLSEAALCHRCPLRTDLMSLAGIDRTNGVDQREASEDVQRSVTSFLKPSHSAVLDRFSDPTGRTLVLEN